MSTTKTHPVRRLALALTVAASLLVAAGCNRQNDQDLLASAQAFLAKDDRKAAIVQLKAALQQNPNLAEARFLLGQALFNEGDGVAATLELEKALELRHDDSVVLPALALALLATGQAKKLTDLHGRTRLQDAAAHAALKATVAEAFVALGNIERAEAATNQALALDAGNAAARLLQARFTAGRGRVDEALAITDAVLSDNPKQILAWQLKGELLWAAKQDITGASEAFRQTLLLEPRYIPGHTNLMTFALQKQDWAAFRTQLEKLRAVMPNSAETYFFEAQLALHDGDPQRARNLTQQLLRAAPDNYKVLQLAGAIESNGGSLVLAESHLNKALQLQPQLSTARQLLARIYLRTGQSARASTVLQPLLSGSPSADDLALAAEAQMQNGKLAEAEALFKRAQKANPSDVRVRTALAVTGVAQGRVAEGLADLEAISRTDPGTYADLALISSLLRRQDVGGALSAIDRLEAKMPKAAMPHELRGQALMQRKDPAAARSSFEKALSADPGYFPAAASLAALDVAEKKLDSALKRYQDQLAREPRNYRALLAVAELKLKTGAPADEIRTLLADAIKANPGEAAPRLLLVDFLLARNEVGPARAAAQEAVASIPASLPLLDALGRAQLAAGEMQQAISSFTKLATDQPTSVPAYLRLAQAQARNKDYRDAERSLRKALQIDPRAIQAQHALVELALAEGRFPEALRVAQAVQKQGPAAAVGYLLESDVHAARQDWASAITALQTALQRQKLSPVAIRLHGLLTVAGRQAEAGRLAASWVREQPRDAQFIFHLGAVAMQADRFAEAEAHFRSVLGLLPDDATTLNNVAWVMTKQRKAGAIPFAERAVKLLPDQPALMDTLAGALAAEGQLPQAIDWQRKALAKAGTNASYRLHLARLLIQSGDKSGAKAELNTLTALGDKFADHAEVQQLLKSL